MRKIFYLCLMLVIDLDMMAQTLDLTDENWELVKSDDFSESGRGWNTVTFKELPYTTPYLADWYCKLASYGPCYIFTTDDYHQVYQPSNCKFVDGNLLLIAKYKGNNELRCSLGDYVLPGNATCTSCEPHGKHFLSGMIRTDSCRYGFGYYEIRYKTPAHSDSHCGFWLHGNGPNTYEEIDIMEYSNDDCEQDTLRGYSSGIWYNPDGTNYGANPITGKKAENVGKEHSHLPSDEPNLRQYHTFGCEWMPSYVKWYRDGKIVAEYRERDSIPQYKKRLLVTYQIGSYKSFSPLTNWTGTDTLAIDYVRVYKLKSDCNTDVTIRSLNAWNSYSPGVKSSIVLGSTSGLTVPQGAGKTLLASNSITIDQPFVIPSGTQVTLMIWECPENPTYAKNYEKSNPY